VGVRPDHDGEPKGLQLLNAADADLEFAHPLEVAGVEGIIIWGSEDVNGTKQLLEWFKTNAAVFGGAPSDSGSLSATTVSPTTSALDRFKSPPVPTDGPIPRWKECGL
jgi:hypothetical protein